MGVVVSSAPSTIPSVRGRTGWGFSFGFVDFLSPLILAQREAEAEYSRINLYIVTFAKTPFPQFLIILLNQSRL